MSVVTFNRLGVFEVSANDGFRLNKNAGFTAHGAVVERSRNFNRHFNNLKQEPGVARNLSINELVASAYARDVFAKLAQANRLVLLGHVQDLFRQHVAGKERFLSECGEYANACFSLDKEASGQLVRLARVRPGVWSLGAPEGPARLDAGTRVLFYA